MNKFVEKIYLGTLQKLAGGVGGGDFQRSDENKMNLSTKGIKMSLPSLETGPKIP